MKFESKKISDYFNEFNSEFETIRQKEEILAKGLWYRPKIEIDTTSTRTISYSIYYLKENTIFDTGRKALDHHYIDIYSSAVEFCDTVLSYFLETGRVPRRNANLIAGSVRVNGSNEMFRLIDYCNKVALRFKQEIVGIEKVLLTV